MDKVLFAPAKVNLSLYVIGRRDDGYHTLNTLIAFTNLGDTLTLKPAPSFTFRVDGPFAHHAPADDRNLVTRAVQLMTQACHVLAHIDVTLTKSIPAGAGLGGGSADAAAIMHALNDMWGKPLTLSELQILGVKLGAELPVCLMGPGVYRVEGIGERITPVDAAPLNGVVIWPGVTLATGDVFKAYKGERHDQNDLMPAAIGQAPAIGQALAALDCEACGMSGSGSSVFGICDDAKEKAAKIAAQYPDWWVREFVINPS